MCMYLSACRQEDTCMSYEEEDTCMSYEEEDTCMSYEEEDTCMSYEEYVYLCMPPASHPHTRVVISRAFFFFFPEKKALLITTHAPASQPHTRRPGPPVCIFGLHPNSDFFLFPLFWSICRTRCYVPLWSPL